MLTEDFGTLSVTNNLEQEGKQEMPSPPTLKSKHSNIYDVADSDYYQGGWLNNDGELGPKINNLNLNTTTLSSSSSCLPYSIPKNNSVSTNFEELEWYNTFNAMSSMDEKQQLIAFRLSDLEEKFKSINDNDPNANITRTDLTRQIRGLMRMELEAHPERVSSKLVVSPTQHSDERTQEKLINDLFSTSDSKTSKPNVDYR